MTVARGEGPKVSVCVVTYNHEAFIAECLQSIIEQQTEFEFEVIVGDDCSTDRTVEIVREFEKKHPHKIRLLQHEKNVGPTANYLAVHSAARGEYVAHLDGDDSALPGKLRAQADCLDSHPDVSFAVHAVSIMGTSKVLGRKAEYPIKGTLNDLLMLGTYFVHSSVMYRRALEFNRAAGTEIVDFYFHVERASKGSVYFDDRVFGSYRVHANGVSQSLARRTLIEECYDAAFDRALKLGAPVAVVRAARLKRRMAFALASLSVGDTAAYKAKIALRPGDLAFASRKHVVLYRTNVFPCLPRFLLWMKTKIS